MLFKIKSKQKSLGFTIIELLVVIVVIGILSALVVVAYNGITNRAKESSLLSDMVNARKTLAIYYVDNGYYPDYNDCSVPESSTTICLRTSQNNSIEYMSGRDTYVIYGSITDYPDFFRASDEESPRKFKGWRQISAGSYHICGIYYNGKAYCWGWNDYGQLGDGTDGNDAKKNQPVAVKPGAIGNQTIKSIVARGKNTCAIAADNKAYCWGWNDYGQLGDGTIVKSNVPVKVSVTGAMGDKTIRSIVSMGAYNCVIASDNKVYCWGYNYYGGLGDGTYTNNNQPVAVLAGDIGNQAIKSISAGVCAIASDNKAYCWGINDRGQLGDNTRTKRNQPVAVKAGEIGNQTIESIVSMGGHTCAIASDNKAYCWGDNVGGQLGDGSDGSDASKNLPVAVKPGAIGNQTIKSIVAGDNHTCAIASDNKAYCWGNNFYGQLGYSAGSKINQPVAVSAGAIGSKTVRSIVAGYAYTCAIASDDKAYCWGSNDNGQLGNGSAFDRNSSTPVLVKNP